MNERTRMIAILSGLTIVFFFSLINFYDNVIKYERPIVKAKGGANVKTETVSDKGFTGGWDDVIVEKNLFSPERGIRIEPPEEDVKEAIPEKEPPELKLKGIIQGPEGEYIALIQTQEGKTLKLRSGEEREGLTIETIDPVSVTLRWEESTIELTLKRVKTLEKR
ncbi:MAG: hypothetical protein D6726_03215 [Nitrospirae bacterium]|nr:MAG: hypothetical protein D6726_03215 [Nitrospirota bacterium]